MKSEAMRISDHLSKVEELKEKLCFDREDSCFLFFKASRRRYFGNSLYEAGRVIRFTNHRQLRSSTIQLCALVLSVYMVSYSRLCTDISMSAPMCIYMDCIDFYVDGAYTCLCLYKHYAYI